ncbi:3'(2'),5'-bisphosphate nucleotidase CysQ [Kineococcus gypseus]|uniref:3'(2'),5'-bisphosphate nucleotidase CysQ n=1 Tax=Kineococcus gypseus TaxID=1637102 RepID=UPI003D7CBB68
MAGADDHRVAAALAAETGRQLLALRGAVAPAELRARGDARGQEVLAALLGRLRPRDAVLSEEAADDPVRLASRRVWIVDPLDGTREYGEPPRTDWAVHVALWEDGDLVAGAVEAPAAGRAAGTGAAVPVPARAPGPLRVVVSRSRPPALAHALHEQLGAQLVPMGSAGAKALAVVHGEADAYVHAGGQHEWDSAAPVAVARAAGLHASRLDGSALRYNRPDPSLPDLLVCRPEVAEAVLGVLAAAR